MSAEVERRPSRRVKHVGEDLFYLFLFYLYSKQALYTQTFANNGTQGQKPACRLPIEASAGKFNHQTGVGTSSCPAPSPHPQMHMLTRVCVSRIAR